MASAQSSKSWRTPLSGQVIVYESEGSRLSAFIAGQTDSVDTCLIMIGGMTDGLMFADFVAAAAQSLPKSCKVSVCSPILASSYNQFGMQSLDRDVQDVDALISALQSQFPSLTRFILFGHSTGSQLLVTYGKQGKHLDRVLGFVLHAPVSDSDWLYDNIPNVQELYAKLEVQVRENPSQLHSEFYPGIVGLDVPITVGRLFSLLNDEGQMFSSRPSQQELERMLGHMRPLNVLILYAGADEYVSEGTDKTALVARLIAAMGGGHVGTHANNKLAVIVDGADHSFHGKEVELVHALEDWMASFL